MTGPRRILVVAHTWRADALDAGAEVCRRLLDAGITVVVSADERSQLTATAPELDALSVLGDDVAVEQLELVVVVGGDGTILRAAEIARGSSAPLLGVNLGHVGFLAEADREELGAVIQHVLDRDYTVEERLSLDVRVKDADDDVLFETWALNEVSIEKASRERMLEVAVEIDRRPLSTFGCDGIVVSTPTGSTAYAFSAGGPVVWPSVEAILLVPLSAHALFSRPLVVGPESALAIELLDRSTTQGVLWCDGRRSFDLPPGSRVVVRRSPTPVRLARMTSAPFTDRLVGKFNLPVAGWRGPTDDEGQRG